MKQQKVTLAVDAMGGDEGLNVTVPASVRLAHDYKAQVEVLLVGDEEQIKASLPKPVPPNISILHASEVVEMDDSVATAMRLKKNSSMRIAINQVKAQRAQAAVSAGNTGALMAISRFALKTLPGIDRPAICTAIPVRTGHCHMLDLGANVDSTHEHLVQFAMMGSALVKAVDGCESPSVALLNIGEEEIKGNESIKQANKLLTQSNTLNYVGYIEGNRVFDGKVNVVVCDGFVGNVALKTMEGVASMIGGMIKEEVSLSWFRKGIAAFALPIWRALGKKMDPQRYNGASLLGLNGVVVKSHGSADETGFYSALLIAMEEARRDVPGLIRHALNG